MAVSRAKNCSECFIPLGIGKPGQSIMCDECFDRVNSIKNQPSGPVRKITKKKLSKGGAIGGQHIMSASLPSSGIAGSPLVSGIGSPKLNIGAIPQSNTDDEYKEVLKYLKDMKDYIESTKLPAKKEDSKPQLTLFRVSVSLSPDPNGKYRKNGSLRNFALGGTLFALGTDEKSLIATLQNGILKEVHTSRIAVGEHVGPFNHGHIISEQQNK